MKFIAAVLCVMVIWLSVMPCCTTDTATTNVSEKTLSAKSGVADNCCASCSPFYSCGSCSAITLPKILQPSMVTAATGAARLYLPYAQPFIKQVTLSIWQPPKLS